MKHYAGEVLYKVDGLIEKSRDLLHNDLEVLMASSSDTLVRPFVSSSRPATPGLSPTAEAQAPPRAACAGACCRRARLRKGGWAALRSRFVPPEKGRVAPASALTPLCVTPLRALQVRDVIASRAEEAPATAAPSRGPARQKLSAPSLGAQFTRQLNSLMSNLHATQPHFIKCIKPNPEKRGGLYIVDDVLTQLRYTGIFGLCKLRQAGYSERPTLEEFFGRYRVMCRPWPKDVERLVAELSQRGFLKPKMWVKGKTKMMLKHEQATDLEARIPPSVARSLPNSLTFLRDPLRPATVVTVIAAAVLTA